MPEEDLTADRLLGGRLVLLQSRDGHRAGTDAVLLAAAAALVAGDRFVDVGAGTGAAGIALALRDPTVGGLLLEMDPSAAALAHRNCARNGVESRVGVAHADLFDGEACRAAGVRAEGATLVISNPPFHRANEVRSSPDVRRAKAHVLAVGGHAHWFVRALACLAPHGRFAAIHRPAALPALLEACKGRLGAVAVRPVQPREGAEASRILISGIKGSRAPLRICPGLVLHGADGRFTAEAEAVHRGEALLTM